MSLTANRRHLVDIRHELGREEWGFVEIDKGESFRTPYDPSRHDGKEQVGGFMHTILRQPSFVAEHKASYQGFRIMTDDLVDDVATVSDTDGLETKSMSVYSVADYLKRLVNKSSDE